MIVRSPPSIRNHLSFWLGYLLLFMILVFPTVASIKSIKMSVLIFLIWIIVIAFIRNDKIQLHPSMLRWGWFVVFLGLTFTLVGYASRAQGATASISVYVIWPIVYLALVAGLGNNKDGALRIQRVLLLAESFIILISLNYIWSQLGIISQLSFLKIFDFGQGFNFYDSYVESRLYAYSSLIFLLPYSFALLCVSVDNKLIGKIWLWLIFLAGSLVAISSGRRILLFILIISPIFIIIFRYYQSSVEKAANRKQIYYLLLVLPFCLLILILFINKSGLNIGEIARQLFASLGIGSNSDPDFLIRRDESYALLHTWLQHPFIGNGLGSFAPNYIRDYNMPWAYELYYLSLLNQVGFIGLTGYAAAIIWIFRRGIQVIRAGGLIGRLMLANLTGLACFLVGAGTNPYLPKFDGMWVIFVPMVLINIYLLSQNESTGSREKISGALG